MREFEKSKISEHALDEGHKINWNSTKILTKESNNKKRMIKESAYILLNEDKCVSNCSIEFSRAWLQIQDEIDTDNINNS